MRIAQHTLTLLFSLSLIAQTSSGEVKGMGSNGDSPSRKGYKFQIVEVAKTSSFDIGKIGGLGRVETTEKFGRIWELFRKNYALNQDGVFVEAIGANTTSTPVTQNEFLHFVVENNPTVILSTTEKCSRCSGRGKRTALFNGNTQGAESQIGSVACEECLGFGKIKLIETIKLSLSGKLPARPSKEERQALAVKPTPPAQVIIVDKKGQQNLVNIEPNDERVIIFNEIKAKAARGDLDAEYKYATYFQEGKHPVTRDPKDFESKMHSLADKGYNEAYGQLAQIHLRRASSNLGGAMKIDPEEIAECIKWKLLYDGRITIHLEVSEATQAEGKRRADSYLVSHPKPAEIPSNTGK
jgi:hypothetical protein